MIDQTTGEITGYKTSVGADTVFPFSKKDGPFTFVETGIVSYTRPGNSDTTFYIYPTGSYTRNDIANTYSWYFMDNMPGVFIFEYGFEYNNNNSLYRIYFRVINKHPTVTFSVIVRWWFIPREDFIAIFAI